MGSGYNTRSDFTSHEMSARIKKYTSYHKHLKLPDLPMI